MVEVVTKLVETLEEPEHVVIADRGFGSPAVVDAIKQKGHYCIVSCK